MHGAFFRQCTFARYAKGSYAVIFLRVLGLYSASMRFGRNPFQTVRMGVPRSWIRSLCLLQLGGRALVQASHVGRSLLCPRALGMIMHHLPPPWHPLLSCSMSPSSAPPHLSSGQHLPRPASQSPSTPREKKLPLSRQNLRSDPSLPSELTSSKTRALRRGPGAPPPHTCDTPVLRLFLGRSQLCNVLAELHSPARSKRAVGQTKPRHEPGPGGSWWCGGQAASLVPPPKIFEHRPGANIGLCWRSSSCTSHRRADRGEPRRAAPSTEQEEQDATRRTNGCTWSRLDEGVHVAVVGAGCSC